MKPLAAQPSLVEQVYEQILSEIIGGRLEDNPRLIQDDLAKTLGVSRQPVQQALLLLRNQGFLRDAPGRGLVVAPIDADFVRDLFEVRAATEALACRLAADRGCDEAAKLGAKFIEDGRKAEAEGSVPKLIAADKRFHEFLYEISGNGLIKDMMQPYWAHLRRLMGEVLLKDETPRKIWDQHEAILAAVISGNGAKAEELARAHIANAATVFIERMANSEHRSAARRRAV
ncbi:MAG: GntR family transcriptional regulator [Hyphomicrobiaceae bacterium]